MLLEIFGEGSRYKQVFQPEDFSEEDPGHGLVSGQGGLQNFPKLFA